MAGPAPAPTTAVIAFDAFDHTDYASPACVAPGMAGVQRQRLMGNYTAAKPRRQDRRPEGHPRTRTIQNRYTRFTSDDREPYQYLVVTTLGSIKKADHPGYVARLKTAKTRFAAWKMQQEGGEPTALEVLYFERFVGDGAPIRVQTRAMPFAGRHRRYRVNVTPTVATSSLTYMGTNLPRYLFLPPATGRSPIPNVYRDTVKLQAKVKDHIKSDGDGVPRYAAGCTCRDFVFNGQNKDGTLGGAAYGCKHMIFWELCRDEAEQTPDVPVITYPPGVVAQP